MSDEPFEATFVLTRKPLPPEPPEFVCVVCDKAPMRDRWRPHVHSPPICAYCANHWSSCTRPPGITRGDHRTLIRLTAIVNRLEWEIRNGNRRWG